MRKLATVTLLFALSVAAPLYAGTVITVERRELPDGTAEPTTMSIDGKLLAIAGDPADGRVLFRGDRQQMLVVDDEDKTYMVIDQTMIEGVATQMGAMMKQMEEALKDLPPEQQAAARRMMQQQQPATAAPAQPEPEEDVRRTSERATREGYPCVKYEVFENEVKVRELWVTDWSNVEAQGDIATAMRSFGNFTRKLTSSLGALGGSSSPASSTTSLASWWHGIDGLPIVTTDLENGVPVEESVVRSIAAASLDPRKVFEVPEDYTQQTVGGP